MRLRFHYYSGAGSRLQNHGCVWVSSLVKSLQVHRYPYLHFVTQSILLSPCGQQSSFAAPRDDTSQANCNKKKDAPLHFSVSSLSQKELTSGNAISREIPSGATRMAEHIKKDTETGDVKMSSVPSCDSSSPSMPNSWMPFSGLSLASQKEKRNPQKVSENISALFRILGTSFCWSICTFDSLPDDEKEEFNSLAALINRAAAMYTLSTPPIRTTATTTSRGSCSTPETEEELVSSHCCSSTDRSKRKKRKKSCNNNKNNNISSYNHLHVLKGQSNKGVYYRYRTTRAIEKEEVLVACRLRTTSDPTSGSKSGVLLPTPLTPHYCDHHHHHSSSSCGCRNSRNTALSSSPSHFSSPSFDGVNFALHRHMHPPPTLTFKGILKGCAEQNALGAAAAAGYNYIYDISSIYVVAEKWKEEPLTSSLHVVEKEGSVENPRRSKEAVHLCLPSPLSASSLECRNCSPTAREKSLLRQPHFSFPCPECWRYLTEIGRLKHDLGLPPLQLWIQVPACSSSSGDDDGHSSHRSHLKTENSSNTGRKNDNNITFVWDSHRKLDERSIRRGKSAAHVVESAAQDVVGVEFASCCSFSSSLNLKKTEILKECRTQFSEKTNAATTPTATPTFSSRPHHAAHSHTGIQTPHQAIQGVVVYFVHRDTTETSL